MCAGGPRHSPIQAELLGLPRYSCKQCKRSFRNRSGLTQHVHAKHPRFWTSSRPTNHQDVGDLHTEEDEEPPADPYHSVPGSDTEVDNGVQPAFIGPGNNSFRNYHPGLTGQPCNADGDFLPNGTRLEPRQPKPPDDWSPYSSRLEFELADFIYTRSQISAANLNTLLELWAASLVEAGGKPMFGSYKEMYWMIDNTRVGDVKWQSFMSSILGMWWPILCPGCMMSMTFGFEILMRLSGIC